MVRGVGCVAAAPGNDVCSYCCPSLVILGVEALPHECFVAKITIMQVRTHIAKVRSNNALNLKGFFRIMFYARLPGKLF